ncbi:50S ribosomal protein L21 [Candidatus Peregrinibacteria bacterium]|nr:50S ribosomal protein L21 [Candidatus Peregrinibacteria bacterium]
MLAVAEIKGNQYLVKAGDVLTVQKMTGNKEGEKLKIDQVLITIDGATTVIGVPYVKGAQVELLVRKHYKGDKIRVFKKKAKKRYVRTQGHRQWHTDVEVLKVT